MADFKLQQKISRMISSSAVWVRNMQKPDKFVVGQKILESEWYILRMAILGNEEKGSKRPYQGAIDKELKVLHGYIDLAVQPENHLISQGAHEEWTQMLDEIGRILGGWVKKTE